MIGPWINNESQRLVVALGSERRDGPKLDMTMFVVGLVVFLLLIGYYFFAPIPQKYSDVGTSVITYGGLAAFCFVLQHEYRPGAQQFGVSGWILESRRRLAWTLIGIAFTGVELGLMYGFARLLFSTLPQHHIWTIRLEPLDRLVRQPFELLITVVIGPVLEELFCRGYVYLVLRQNWGRRRAALISSAVFASLHLENVLLAAIFFFVSLIYVYLDNKARSLAPSIAAHASYNLVLSLLKFNLT